LTVVTPSWPTDQHLLAVWLNFADATIAFDNWLTRTTTTCRIRRSWEALAAADAVRLNPASTVQELSAQKNLLAHLLQKPKK
jgi:hypothetical protein